MTTARPQPHEQVPYRPLRREDRVLAVIPHFSSEEWLGQAIASITGQTRPPDQVVVIDDASPAPPTSLVGNHPGVTLLRSDLNVGPYRLIQQVISASDCDAILFQDADDWSAPNRLDVLLATGEEAGSPYVGCQKVDIVTWQSRETQTWYPLDPRAALSDPAITFPIHHPSTLVSRALVMGIGGFATGLRFGGDFEFFRRAVHVAPVVNTDQVLYYYRRHGRSLTGNQSTGLGSPLRRQTSDLVLGRARLNDSRALVGLPPILAPIAVGNPVPLRRLAGPAVPAVGLVERTRP